MSMVDVCNTLQQTNPQRGSFNSTLILLFRSEGTEELKRDRFPLLWRICLKLSPRPESQLYLKGHKDSPWEPPMAAPLAAQECDVPSYRGDGRQQQWPYRGDLGQAPRPTMLYDLRRHDTPDFNEYMPLPETGQPTFPQQWDQTMLDEISWLQIAWCSDEDGYFLPRKALHPPEDLVKLVFIGLSRSWAFTKVRPTEDVMELLRHERNHTSHVHGQGLSEAPGT